MATSLKWGYNAVGAVLDSLLARANTYLSTRRKGVNLRLELFIYSKTKAFSEWWCDHVKLDCDADATPT